MNEILLLRLGRRPNDPIEWLIWNGHESRSQAMGRLAHADELAQLATAAHTRPCYVLLPQEQVLMTEVRLPNGSRAALDTIPYQLEERLCEDPALLHFAIGRPDGDRRYPVAVIARVLIEDWRDRLVSAAIAVNGVFADAQSLQPQPGLLAQGDRWLSAGTDQRALALSQRELETWRPLLEQEGALELSSPDPTGSPMELLASHLAPEQAINLLQGDYRLQDRKQALKRSWRMPAVLVLILLLLNFASLGFENYRLSRQKADLDQQVEDLFHEALPAVRRIVNPRAQLAQKLDELRLRSQGPLLLRLLEKTLPAFQQHTTVRLTGLRYEQENPTLTLALESSNAGIFVQFQVALEQNGLRVQSGESQNHGQISTLQLSIEEATQ